MIRIHAKSWPEVLHDTEIKEELEALQNPVSRQQAMEDLNDILKSDNVWLKKKAALYRDPQSRRLRYFTRIEGLLCSLSDNNFINRLKGEVGQSQGEEMFQFLIAECLYQIDRFNSKDAEPDRIQRDLPETTTKTPEQPAPAKAGNRFVEGLLAGLKRPLFFIFALFLCLLFGLSIYYGKMPNIEVDTGSFRIWFVEPKKDTSSKDSTSTQPPTDDDRSEPAKDIDEPVGYETILPDVNPSGDTSIQKTGHEPPGPR